VVIHFLPHLLEGPSRSLDIQRVLFRFTKYFWEIVWKESA